MARTARRAPSLMTASAFLNAIDDACPARAVRWAFGKNAPEPLSNCCEQARLPSSELRCDHRRRSSTVIQCDLQRPSVFERRGCGATAGLVVGSLRAQATICSATVAGA